MRSSRAPFCATAPREPAFNNDNAGGHVVITTQPALTSASALTNHSPGAWCAVLRAPRSLPGFGRRAGLLAVLALTAVATVFVPGAAASQTGLGHAAGHDRMTGPGLTGRELAGLVIAARSVVPSASWLDDHPHRGLTLGGGFGPLSSGQDFLARFATPGTDPLVQQGAKLTAGGESGNAGFGDYGALRRRQHRADRRP